MMLAWYRSVDDVETHEDFSPRQYRTWRKHFFVLTHGDLRKKQLKALPQIALKEARDMIGETLYSSVHTGHLHHEVVRIDEAGWTHQQAPSPALIDEYHDGQGYVASRRAVQGILYYEDGSDEVITLPLRLETEGPAEPQALRLAA